MELMTNLEQLNGAKPAFYQPTQLLPLTTHRLWIMIEIFIIRRILWIGWEFRQLAWILVWIEVSINSISFESNVAKDYVKTIISSILEFYQKISIRFRRIHFLTLSTFNHFFFHC